MSETIVAPNSTASTSNDIENFKQYTPLSVKDQITLYRQIYDKALALKIPKFQKDHIDGLFGILTNGFALAEEYVNNHNLGKKLATTPNSRKLALKRIRNLFQIAQTLNDNTNLTQFNFVTLNLLLAAILDSYKKNHISPSFKVTKDIEECLDSLSLESLKTIWKLTTSFNVKKWQMNTTGASFMPPLVIYNENETRISPVTFVNELLNPNYRGVILLLDVSSKNYIATNNKEGTKKDPHYSLFNGSYRMMAHDINHHLEQQEMESTLWDEYNINWSQELGRVNKIRQDMISTNQNAYKVLTNGLFLLSHELYNISENNFNAYLKYRNNLPTEASFFDVILYIKDSMIGFVPELRKTEHRYKADHRDHEFILKGSYDKEGIPFLAENFSTFDERKKQNAVRDGYNRFWNFFLILIYPHLR